MIANHHKMKRKKQVEAEREHATRKTTILEEGSSVVIH